MSNALAFAAVTECIKDVLHTGLSLPSIQNVVGNYDVTSVAPDLIKASTLATNQLNVFLYQITPNAALRNADLPTRTGDGDQTRRPVLAVDLHYLITAYSRNGSQAEIMLGQASHLLHDRPIFSKHDISTMETKWTAGADPFLKNIAASGLSGQMEIVRIITQEQSAEELSKLWSAFQTPYRPTMAFLVSVLLIEAEGPSRRVLPVLTIGENDRGPTVEPNLILSVPLLVKVGFPDQEISATLSVAMDIEGHHLDGANPGVDFVSLHDDRRLAASIMQSHTANKISVKLTDAHNASNPALPPKDAWSIGPYSVTVRIRKPGEAFERTTNRLIFALAPKIDGVALSMPGGKLRAIVNCSPKVNPGQRATLIIGDWEITAKPFATATDQLEFEEKLPDRIKSGEQYLFRLRVDEVESPFIDRTKEPPGFRADARKTIP
ncbi:MAG: DUF4255 domain-containing protein [Acidobacteria bacterium]|nr:DUF4255 domain-containing protein [Acidobacteriota bacterium]